MLPWQQDQQKHSLCLFFIQVTSTALKMYKLDVRVDTKESAAIERRRIMEQQRQSRIFDARERTIGVGFK